MRKIYFSHKTVNSKKKQVKLTFTTQCLNNIIKIFSTFDTFRNGKYILYFILSLKSVVCFILLVYIYILIQSTQISSTQYPHIASSKHNRQYGGGLAAKSCLTLATPWTVCSLPGSSVHGILQARIVEWVAISCSKKNSTLSIIGF